MQTNRIFPKLMHDGLLPENTFAVYADNVAEYFYEQNKEKDWEWNIEKDFPNLAPPFEHFFIEYKLPNSLFGEIKDIATISFGAYFKANNDWDEPKKLNFSGGSRSGLAKWPLTSRTLFMITTHNGKSDLYPKTWMDEFNLMFIQPDGSVYTWVNGDDGNRTGIVRRVNNNGPLTDEERTELFRHSFPALFAISLMHCKNVKIESSHKVYGKSRNNRRKNPYTYHLLEIKSIHKILSEDGNIQEVGLKKALHICRGHFKDFRDGKGLFGKYRDVYWWDSHTRGSIESGYADKDYKTGTIKTDRQ